MKFGFLKNNRFLSKSLSTLSKWFGFSIRHKRHNKVSIGKSFFKGAKCVFKGKQNLIKIGNNCFFSRCKFYISGNQNNIEIADNCSFYNVTFWIEDNGNKVVIKDNTNFCGLCQIAAIEGTTITVGKRCLFSSNVFLRTGDSHTIADMNFNRINKSQDITIGDHVWVGTNVYILKNTFINNDSVVGACSLVNKRFEQTNCVIAGNPASIKKEHIEWDSKRF